MNDLVLCQYANSSMLLGASQEENENSGYCFIHRNVAVGICTDHSNLFNLIDRSMPDQVQP